MIIISNNKCSTHGCVNTRYGPTGRSHASPPHAEWPWDSVLSPGRWASWGARWGAWTAAGSNPVSRAGAEPVGRVSAVRGAYITGYTAQNLLRFVSFQIDMPFSRQNSSAETYHFNIVEPFA